MIKSLSLTGYYGVRLSIECPGISVAEGNDVEDVAHSGQQKKLMLTPNTLTLTQSSTPGAENQRGPLFSLAPENPDDPLSYYIGGGTNNVVFLTVVETVLQEHSSSRSHRRCTSVMALQHSRISWLIGDDYMI